MMSRRRFAWMASAALAACLAGAFTTGARIAAQSLPSRLSDQEFWKLSSESSEPNGYFRSDNLLSNETGFQYVIPDLIRTTKPGRVYMGVGPEQNFTYIVATKPSMVFIVDVRRGNFDLQLMYKALFELSADRAEFVSRLFCKKRPDGLDARSTATEIFGKFWNVETGERALFVDLLSSEESVEMMSALNRRGGDFRTRFSFNADCDRPRSPLRRRLRANIVGRGDVRSE